MMKTPWSQRLLLLELELLGLLHMKQHVKSHENIAITATVARIAVIAGLLAVAVKDPTARDAIDVTSTVEVGLGTLRLLLWLLWEELLLVGSLRRERTRRRVNLDVSAHHTCLIDTDCNRL